MSSSLMNSYATQRPLARYNCARQRSRLANIRYRVFRIMSVRNRRLLNVVMISVSLVRASLAEVQGTGRGPCIVRSGNLADCMINAATRHMSMLWEFQPFLQNIVQHTPLSVTDVSELGHGFSTLCRIHPRTLFISQARKWTSATSPTH